MKTKILALYSIFIGIAVMVMWVLILYKNDLPEGKLELSFHLFSEFLMAAFCLLSGIGLLKRIKNSKVFNAMGLGMLLYSVLNAAGYYGQREENPMLVMFIVLFFITFVFFLISLEKTKK